MYNDYYLNSIDGKLSNTNSYLYDIIENQEMIIEIQQEIISGDNILINKTQNMINIQAMIMILIATMLTTNIIIRSLK